MLTFSEANGKLRELENKTEMKVYSFDLPAGYSCPFAVDCKSCCKNGKIKDFKSTKFRCYSASIEAVYPNVHNMRMRNFHILKACKTMEKMVEVIEKSLPSVCCILRIHTSGDFFKEMYFRAWMAICKKYPMLKVYCYTKAFPYIVKHGELPNNFRYIYSMGGKYDRQAIEKGLRYTCVVKNIEEAMEKALFVSKSDHDVLAREENLGLLVHGIQPANSEYGKFVWRGKNKSVNTI